MTEEHGFMIDESDRFPKEGQAPALAPTVRKKVLVIDDDRTTRYLLSQILAQSGFDTVEAEDGEAGLRMASEERPDLVLVDGLLPKMHGFLVCKAIKELENPPKVIVLTAVYKKITYRWQVRTEYGADELLIKPINKAEMVSCIARVLSADAESAVPAIALPSGEPVSAPLETLHAKA